MNQEPLLNEDDDNEEESLELQEVVIDKQPQVMWVLFKSRLIVNPEIAWLAISSSINNLSF